MKDPGLEKAVEDSSLCALVIADESGQVRYANDSLVHLLRTGRSAIVTKSLAELLHPDCPDNPRGKGLLTGDNGLSLRVDYSRVPLHEEKLQVIWISPGPIHHEKLDRLLKTNDTQEPRRHIDTVTQALAEEFGLDFVVIGSRRRGSLQSDILSFWTPDGHKPFAPYDLAGTPCDEIYNHGQCAVPSDVQHLFPRDAWLKDNHAMGFYGLPLRGGQGEVIGHLAGISQKPLFQHPELEHYFELFAAQVGAVAERVRISDELDDRTQLLADFSSRLPGVLFQLSLRNDSFRLLYAGATLYQLTGVTVSQALENFNRIAHAVHPEDRAFFLEALKHSAQSLSELDWTGRFELDDRVAYLRWMAKPTKGSEGTVSWSGYLTDATELEAMRARQQEVEAVAGIGHFDYQVVTGELHWSAGTFEIFGFDPKKGTPSRQEFLAIMPEEVRELNETSLQNAIRSGQPFDLEWTFPSDNGERHIRTRGKAISDRRGQVCWITGTHFNITRQKQAEEAALISRERLRQAQKMEAVGQLAGGVAHDFNNLLTAILGFTELARTRVGDDQEITSDLDEVLHAARRAQQLTSRLVAIGRKQVVKRLSLDLNHLLKDLQPLLRHAIDEDVALIFDLEHIHGSVLGEIGCIDQIVLNLAVNARDAMPKGGQLKITTRVVPPPSAAEQLDVPVKADRWVLLSAEDTGCGLRQEEIEHIFEPFYTTKPKDKGTGLGLATVYGIVDRMGGVLQVDSKVGEGTLMKVFLPLQDAMPQSSDCTPKQELRGGSETILVVEDDETVRRFSTASLALLGYRVLETACPRMALDLIGDSKNEVELLFTDVIMPGMSGTELARAACQKRPTLKVLFTTGFTQDKTIIHGLDPGQEGVLLKPFSLEELGSRVRSTLDVALPSLGRGLPKTIS